MAKNLIIGSAFLLLCAQSFLGLGSVPSVINRHSLMFLSLCPNRMELYSDRKLLLFVFDFDDFMCMSCLESFLAFCHSLPPHIIEENTWGILTIESAIKKSGLKKSVSIARSKLRGFVLGNRIKFPIFIDEFQVFRQFAKKGTTVLLFDGANNILKEYIFPLSRSHIDEIQEIVSRY